MGFRQMEELAAFGLIGILEGIAHLCKNFQKRGICPKSFLMKVVSVVFNNFLHDSRVLKESISLRKAGYEVEVCALHEGDLPEGEVIEGVPVHRIRLRSRSWSKHRLIQALKYIELWYRFIKRYKKYDLIHCNDVEPLPMCVLTKLLFNRRLRIIYDAHELEYDKAEKGSKYYPNFVIRLAERLCLPFTDAMMVVSPLVAEAYAKHYNMKQPPTVVMNCPYLRPQDAPKPDIFRQKFGIQSNQRIFLYQGTLIPRRGLELLLELFTELPQDYVLVVLGYGPLTEMAQAAARENENIFFHPAVSPTELDDYTASGDIGFCLYQGNSGNHRLTIGNKIFQYINAGLPVIASSLDGLRYILREPGLGIVV
ncbi:MAG TPA: glycosyltransferase, partial [Phaeodactylibacter sp.]|nr:glycosyltransferase [Phaeodactylibacter sp.]